MVHTFCYKNQYYALDVYSGAVLAVDPLFCDLVNHLTPPLPAECPTEVMRQLQAKYAQADLLECYAEMRELADAGHLFSQNTYTAFAAKMVASPVKALCLNVSHDCNLRCAYCFAGKGDYQQGRMVMSAETGRAAIDFLLQQSEGRRFLEVDFFGGEPLMNWSAVKEVVRYARSKEQAHDKSFRFTITTNGLLLDDDKMDYINREMHNVVLSLDGRQCTNDRMRARVNGSGCYDAIVPKFQKLAASRQDKEYYVRGTFTKYNKDFAADVLSLRALGFDQISIEPVVAAPSEPYALTELDLPEIFEEYERLADLLLEYRQSGKWINFFHFMVDLEQGPCAIKRLRGCGCGNEYLCVVPGGDIYPCHQFVGQDAWKMGNIHDGTFNHAIKKQFAKATVYDKPACRDCWAQFYCSGGCNANNYIYQGDIRTAHTLSCDMLKKRLEIAIALNSSLLCTTAK